MDIFTADLLLDTAKIIFEYSFPNYKLASSPLSVLAISQSIIGSSFATLLFGRMTCLLYAEAQLENMSETMHSPFSRLGVAGKRRVVADELV